MLLVSNARRGDFMNPRKNYRIAIAALVVAILLYSPPAYAYLDPGTGSMILQGIIGGLAALAVILKVYWHRVMLLLGIRKDTQTNQQDGSGKPN